MTAPFKSTDRMIANRESGFTFVEVLMAVTIIVMGMLAYGVLSGSLIEKNVRSTRKSIATTLAQDKIEELRNLTLEYKDLTGAIGLSNPDYSSDWAASADEQLDSEGGNSGPLQYTRTWTVVQATGDQGSTGGGNHFFDARVTVAWVDKQSRSVVLDSRISD